MQNNLVVWFTGLSGSGKSTIAQKVAAQLKEKNFPVYELDGDVLRDGLNKDLGFTEADRRENIRRAGEIAKLFFDKGFIVLCTFISPFRNDRQNVRKLFPTGKFIEVYVNASLAVCEQRDVKGLYKKARTGELKNFTGISSPYEEPLSAEITVSTEKNSADENAKNILQYLLPLLKS
jgi:adenylyl-sulfate kinase